MNTVRMPYVDSAVIPDLNTFLAVFTHLPVEVQIDLLRQAVEQMSKQLDNLYAR